MLKPGKYLKLKTQSLISALIIVVGIALMAFMIITEDEPGVIPLLIIVTATGWYVYSRSKIRSQKPHSINNAR